MEGLLSMRPSPSGLMYLRSFHKLSGCCSSFCVADCFPKTSMAGENNVMEVPLHYSVLHLRMLQEFTHAQLATMGGTRNNSEDKTVCALLGQ